MWWKSGSVSSSSTGVADKRAFYQGLVAAWWSREPMNSIRSDLSIRALSDICEPSRARPTRMTVLMADQKRQIGAYGCRSIR